MLHPEQRGGRHDWRDYLSPGLQHPFPCPSPPHHPPSERVKWYRPLSVVFTLSFRKKKKTHFVSHDCVVLQIMLNATRKGERGSGGEQQRGVYTSPRRACTQAGAPTHDASTHITLAHKQRRTTQHVTTGSIQRARASRGDRSTYTRP